MHKVVHALIFSASIGGIVVSGNSIYARYQDELFREQSIAEGKWEKQRVAAEYDEQVERNRQADAVAMLARQKARLDDEMQAEQKYQTRLPTSRAYRRAVID